MPKLSHQEVQRRGHMIAQELRIAKGGEPLKNQLESQITELRKSLYLETPPKEQHVHQVVSQLQDQLSMIADDAWHQQLEEWDQTAKAYQQSMPMRMSSSTRSDLFNRANVLVNPKSGSMTHMTLPLMPNLAKNEEEILQELVCLMSEMAQNYNPRVFMERFIDCYAVCVEHYGSASAFSEKLIAICKQNRTLLKDIYDLFGDESIPHLIDQMHKTFELEEEVDNVL